MHPRTSLVVFLYRLSNHLPDEIYFGQMPLLRIQVDVPVAGIETLESLLDTRQRVSRCQSRTVRLR